MRRKSLVVLAFAALGWGAVAPGLARDCANAPLGAPGLPRVLHQAPPPPTQAAQDRRAWPATDFVTTDVKRLRTGDPAVSSYFFLWVNRCQGAHGHGECGGNQKGNLPALRDGGREARFAFSSREAADACTLLQLGRLLDRNDAALAGRAAAAGLAVTDRPEAVQAEGRHGDRSDVCLVSPQPLPAHVQGVVVDYEPQDNRSAAATAELLRQLAGLARAAGKRIVLYTNPLDGPGVRRSGLTPEVINALAGEFELVSLLPVRRGSDPVDSLRRQRALLAAVPAPRLMLVYDLASFSNAETRRLREEALAMGIASAMIWRNGMGYGDACTSPGTAKIRCLATGACG